MKARFIIGNITYPLCEVSKEDMTEIRKDRSKRMLRGYPQYFDGLGRLWPKPQDGVVVEFYDK